jgi:hypothetical protein
MTQATTTTTVREVRSFIADETTPDFIAGTDVYVYQTLDGSQYVTTSWSPTTDENEANTMAWESDESGLPTPQYVVRMLFADTEFYVDGPSTQETREAALAQQGYTVERQEDAA